MSSSTDDEGDTALAPLPDKQASRGDAAILSGQVQALSAQLVKNSLYRSANLRAATIPRATIRHKATIPSWHKPMRVHFEIDEGRL